MQLLRSKNSDDLLKNKFFIFFSVGFIILFFIDLYLDVKGLIDFFSVKTIHFTDFTGQWKICALALRGVDPYLEINVADPAIPEIGSVPEGWGTSPWGILLGNFIYPGFLSESAAAKWFIAVFIIVLTAAGVTVFLKLKKRALSFAIIAIPVLLLPDNIIRSFISGNAGFILCAFTIMAIMLCDDFPIVSGVLIGLAMIKPQVAALACLVLLFMKKFKVLITGAIVDVAAALAVCVMVKKTPWALVSEFLGANIGGNNSPYRGYMNFLNIKFGMDENLTMALSMALGIVFTAAAFFFLRNKTSRESKELPFYIFFIPCLITTMWSYSWLNDYYIVVPAALVFLHELSYAEKAKTKILSGFLLLLSSFSYVIIILISKLLVVLIKLTPVFAFLNPSNVFSSRFYYESILLVFLIIYIFSKAREARSDGKSEKLS